MKELIKKIFAWMDAGLEPKTKVLVGFLFLVMWGLTYFGYAQVKQQRDDFIERAIYLREQINIERQKTTDCENEKAIQLYKIIEYSNRQRERADSILNAIMQLKK